MDKKGKNQGRYGGGGGVHATGKGDEGGRFDRREDAGGNRRAPRTDQATFQRDNWGDSGSQGWQRNNFQRDKKPPIAGNSVAAILPNLPSNIETLPPRFKRKYLQENGLPLDFFEKLQASNPPPPQQPQYNNNNNRAQTLPKGGGGSGGNRDNRGGYFQKNAPPPGRSRSPSDQLGGDSRHSSRNSSLDRKYGGGGGGGDYERRRSPDNFRRGGNEWKTNSNFFNRNKRREDDRRFDDRNGKKDVLDWSQEVEQEDRKREGRSYDGNFENGSRRRNRSNSRSNQDRRNFYTPNDHFKVPFPAKAPRSRSRKNSQSSVSRENSAERSFTRSYRSHSGNRFSSSRENSTERYQPRDPTNWRAPITPQTDTKIAEMTKQFVETVDLKEKPGILTLPNSALLVRNADTEFHNGLEKSLYDPKHPERPIVVTVSSKGVRHVERRNRVSLCEPSTHPSWYDTASDGYRRAHNPQLIEQIYQVDADLQQIVDSRELFREWQHYNEIRRSGQIILSEFLRTDLKFCEIENVEQHCWKLLFYNIIELLRKPLAEANVDAETKQFYKQKLLEIIDPGCRYWEELLNVLEDKYKFRVEDFTGANASNRVYQRVSAEDGKKFVKLALVSVQKIFLYLGDLARYKELINETNNYGKAKQYYTKAQQLLPKNGRPYNQLALLSVYSKRKIDAVYFYMRSLMSSNPFLSARESLIALFDEIRKKYENSQKRREERNRLRLKEKEHRFDGGQLRRETWIHPEGGRKVHRTAPLDPFAATQSANDSTDEEKLNQLDTLEVNKRFITSFLHIQGKLITKIGMESFLQCAIQMLREFRALIQHSPIAITCQRLLQLIALNMFAIDCSQLKDPVAIASGGRSEVQECAVIVGMLMFGIILERFLFVVKEPMQVATQKAAAATTASSAVQSSTEVSNNEKQPNLSAKKPLILPEDAKDMLPAIKVWCDWMAKQQSVWNPPPFYGDYKISSNANYDPWLGLKNLVNLLESCDLESSITMQPSDDVELIKLQENVVLAGFTPIDLEYEPVYSRCGDTETAENDVRLLRILRFGRDILCTCNPPVLVRRNLENGTVEYSNVVQNRPEESSDSEILLECFSDEDDEDISCGDSSTLLLNAIKRGHVNKVEEDVDDDDDDENSNSARSSNNKNNNTTASDSNSKDVAVPRTTTTTTSTTAIDDSDEQKSGNSCNSNENAAEIRRLLRRKDELERKQKMQDKYNQRLQDILSQSTVALNIEVRPKFLVPDTNCFVDYLHQLQAIAGAYPLYQLMVPLVVINELEGLSKGLKPTTASVENSFTALGVVPISATLVSQQTSGRQAGGKHAQMVADASKEALAYLKTKPSAVKLVTTKGHQIKTFIASEDDSCEQQQKSNDDKILDTALNLCKSHKEEIKGDIRRIVREVVLITKDRNLRVKALSNDLPVRELTDFIKWAGLASS